MIAWRESANDLAHVAVLRGRIELQEFQELDLYPRTRYLVIYVVWGDLVLNDDLPQSLRRFDIAALISVWIVLKQGQDQGRDGQTDAHVWIVHK